MDTAEFSKFAGILSAALPQHYLSGFEIAQLEFHHLHSLCEVAIIVNKRVQNAVLGCNLKNDRMISVHFEGKPRNITMKVTVKFTHLSSTLCDPMDYTAHEIL